VFFFGRNTPMDGLAEGDEVSLKRIDRAAIAASHARLYVGSNLIVVAAGGFEPAEMRVRLAKAFGAVPGRPGLPVEEGPAGREWLRNAAAAGG